MCNLRGLESAKLKRLTKSIKQQDESAEGEVKKPRAHKARKEAP